MHSRIFQVSEAPIDPADFLTPDGVPESFTTEVADYVDECEDRGNEINWLLESHRGTLIPGEDRASFTIAEDAKERYFKPSFKSFREALAMLSTTTYPAFIGNEHGPGDHNVEFWLFQLRESYGSKFGFYIYQDDELEQMDQWMRTAKPNTAYYIGGVVDYHF